MDANAIGGAPASGDSGRGLQQVMQQIRDLGQQIQALGAAVPAFGPDVQQMQQILKRLIVKAAQQAPQETASASQVPVGGT